MVHKKSLLKSNFVVVARNVLTGQVVELPISTRDEVKRMKWYPQNDYVPLSIFSFSKREHALREKVR